MPGGFGAQSAAKNGGIEAKIQINTPTFARMTVIINYSHKSLGAIGNKYFKPLEKSNFGRKMAENNDSVTFLKKFLVTTTGSVNLWMFPLLMGVFG